MKKLDQRELTLTKLLGVKEVIPSHEYPASFTLPDSLHTQAREALDDTTADGLARSMSFRYDQDQWSSGPTVIGSGFTESTPGEVTANPGNIPTNFSSALFLRQHLYLYTHPSGDKIDEEQTRQSGLLGFASTWELDAPAFSSRNNKQAVIAFFDSSNIFLDLCVGACWFRKRLLCHMF